MSARLHAVKMARKREGEMEKKMTKGERKREREERRRGDAKRREEGENMKGGANKGGGARYVSSSGRERRRRGIGARRGGG